MISKCINRRLLPMKMHYFLQFGGITSIVAFMPTLAKQLGYSARTVGLIYTFFSVLNVLAKPISGIVVDNFPVKRVVFLSAILSCGLMVVMLNFIQVLPTKNAMHLSCDTNETILYICSFHDDNNAQSSLPKCDKDLSNLLESITVSVTCQLTCEHRNELFREEMCMSWNVFDYCSTPNNTITYRHTLDFFNVSLLINKANLVESTSNFKVKSIQLKEKEVLLPVCKKPVTIMCEMDCSNNVISKSSIDPKIEGSTFESHQFWEFVVIMSLFYIGTSITCSLNDPICFDLLGNKPEDYGKQRCWGSISAGLFSAIGGLLIDYFSEGDLYKNYAPIYYLCLIIMLCDFFIAYRIKITENVASENTWSDVLRLLTDSNVILYIAWIIVMGICSSMIWYYLFWHMEDMTKKYHSDAYPWIKTIEGGATFVQCMGGEMPFLFLSGRIIKLIGYGNCMSLCLLVFAVRFYLYAIIQNPIWILPVELTNGITFGLYHAVLMAYAKIIVPPNSVATLVGISGALFEGVGISIGNLIAGYSYEHFGGVQTFQLFSCGSLMMFVLHVVLFIKFGKMNAVQAAATPADHTSARWTENGERSQVVSNPEQIYIHT